ncbi:MAG TPA: pyridoxal kinase PdxY [Chthoniobacterales bacterium]
MPAPLQLLSVQSNVAYGHVGNSAAVFPLQRLGVEVWAVNTVLFSNHTGYGQWRGIVLPVEAVADVLAGIEERGVFPRCNGVLSGYLGDASLGEAILTTLERIRQVNPKVMYCCDPVMGDVGRGFFVRPDIPEFMRSRAVPAATMVTPNQFELEFLVDVQVTTLASALEAVQRMHRLGPEIVLVTSLRTAESGRDQIEMLAAGLDGTYRIVHPLLPIAVNGAGDATAGLFFAHYLLTGSLRTALQATANSIFAILEKTAQTQEREIQLIAAQEEIARPSQRFEAQQVN